MTGLTPNLAALDKDVELTYSDLLHSVRSLSKLNGRSSGVFMFIGAMLALNVVLTLLRSGPVDLPRLLGLLAALAVMVSFVPGVVWVSYRRLGPEGRRLRVVLGDDFIDYRMGDSLLRVAFPDVVASAWTRYSIALTTKSRMTLHLPRRILDNSAEEFLRAKLLHSEAAPGRIRRRRVLRLLLLWIVLVAALVVAFTFFAKG